ncbi:prepilin-type N-terminal cleavage/methylation domain-containing protein [Prosthecobacter sp.]|jgi:prepilin-type N-terminal cleavage/methylation domain-containing protein|uniref:prepilin-type N-terminal cleavage/methylation domain-containing protein n=1 Tax=Prosthecobacter sp. TaxID=1965333 RepID=UPI003782E277
MKTTLHRPVIHASGLTLLELLVVLSILAVLSTVALTSSSGIADQARYEATQRTLENIREAVLGPSNLRDTDGTLLYTGFVADMGRLPRVEADLTLEELWINDGPADDGLATLAPHAVRQAIAANVDVAAELDPDVYLATGWRGPYLRLSPGNTNVRDGWGAQFILRTQVPAAVAAAGDPIGQVHSFGANGAEDALDDGYDLDVSSVFTTAETAASTTITVELQKADGSPPDMPVPADEIIVRLFAPDPDTGLIAVTRLDDPFSANSLMFDFTTTPGARVVRAYYDTSNDGSIQSSSAVTHLNLRHGGNTRTIILTVP